MSIYNLVKYITHEERNYSQYKITTVSLILHGNMYCMRTYIFLGTISLVFIEISRPKKRLKEGRVWGMVPQDIFNVYCKSSKLNDK